MIWASAERVRSEYVLRIEGRVRPRPEGTVNPDMATGAIEVLTGELEVLKMVFIQDCGLVLNRMAARSQVNGGQIQALSYGMFEARVYDQDLGLMLTDNLEDYKIPGSQEIPDLMSIIDDDDRGRGPIGIGEPPVIPGQSAIANAVFNACGVRLRELPLSPDKVLAGLAALGGGK